MDFPGSDSFLDVVTNIVGILIILVVVVGARARNAASTAASAQSETDPLSREHKRVASLETDTLHSIQQIAGLERELITRSTERAALSNLIVVAEKDLEQRRGALDEKSRQQYDLSRRAAALRDQLYRLQTQRSQATSTRGPTVTVENVPTPISRAVVGKEAHFQLKQGRLVYIPLDGLLERFKTVFREKAMKLQDQAEFVDTVGPIEGFRLRYRLERFDVPMDTMMQTGRGGSYVALTKWELMPVDGQLGEVTATALSPDSQFRERLATLHPHQWTITLWAYQDSFGDFRKVRKELYQLGYSVAGRPLPEGVPIGGSPKGSKSAAE